MKSYQQNPHNISFLPSFSASTRCQAILSGVAAYQSGGATHAVGPPRNAGSWSESVPTATTSRTPLQMLLKEDACALVDMAWGCVLCP